MKKHNTKDINGITLTDGDVINIHQTVNGENIFVILSVDDLDVRYGFDLKRKYEYPIEDLFALCRFTGEPEFEIVGNIYSLIKKLR